MQLDPTAERSGVRLIAYDSVGSTNAEALVLARTGERGPLWIAARTQTAGRGRRGKPWVSEPGNLYATLLLSDPSPPARAAELSFVAALALADALVAIAPALGSRIVMKWPNDVLADGRKIAGILIEVDEGRVAIGIGVNCVSHPADTEFPATDLSAAGTLATAENVLQALSRVMLDRLRQWNAGAGFAGTRTDWLRRAAGVGGDIRVRLPERELTGRFDGLDGNGRLLLALPDGGVEAITAGEVFGLHDPTGPLGR